jgi:hypothetical protein
VLYSASITYDLFIQETAIDFNPIIAVKFRVLSPLSTTAYGDVRWLKADFCFAGFLYYTERERYCIDQSGETQFPGCFLAKLAYIRLTL